MPDIEITDNSAKVLAALNDATRRALEIIGGKAESYAKQRITEVGAVDTGALRNSITHRVDTDGGTVMIGSNINYAPYIELGTGKEYSPPPGWMENNAQRGRGIRNPNIKPKPFLRPAVEDHTGEYKNVIENELKNG